MGHVHGHSNSLAEFSYLDRLVPVLLDEAELFEFEEKEEFEFDVEVDVESSESLLLDDRVHICKWQKHHYMYCTCVAQYTGALTHLLSSENSVDDPPLDWLEESSLSLSEVSVVPDRDELLNHAHPSVRCHPGLRCVSVHRSEGPRTQDYLATKGGDPMGPSITWFPLKTSCWTSRWKSRSPTPPLTCCTSTC